MPDVACVCAAPQARLAESSLPVSSAASTRSSSESLRSAHKAITDTPVVIAESPAVASVPPLAPAERVCSSTQTSEFLCESCAGLSASLSAASHRIRLLESKNQRLEEMKRAPFIELEDGTFARTSHALDSPVDFDDFEDMPPLSPRATSPTREGGGAYVLSDESSVGADPHFALSEEFAALLSSAAAAPDSVECTAPPSAP